MVFSKYQNGNMLHKLDKDKWRLLKFSDVLLDETSKATKIKKEDYLESGLYPIIDQGKEYIAGYSFDNKGIYNDSPIIIFGDHTRSLKYIDFPLYIGADGVKLLKNIFSEEEVLTKYIYYYLCTVDIPNTGYNRHFKYLKEIVFPIPSINIQKQIVEVLDTALDLIDKRKTQIKELDQLIQSVFLKMFGDPVKNSKNWDSIRLEELGDWKSGGTPSRNITEYFKGSIPWLSAGELNNIYSYSSNEYITEEALRNSAAKLIPKGSLLLGMYDTAALKSTINQVECSCNQAVAYAKLDETRVSTLFVYYCIQIGKDHYKRLQRGVRQKNLNLTMIKNITIICPPIELQNEFTNLIKIIQEKNSVFNNGLIEIEKNFHSLIHRAFNGELFTEEKISNQ